MEKNTDFELIDMRFATSQRNHFNAIERTSVQLRLIPNKAVSVNSNLGENCIVVPDQVFEWFTSLITDGLARNLTSVSTLTDGSIIFSENV
ncbi:hypothetical protein [Methanosarcina siciliae]|uniref:hypothetical protein n=1 Tax=Methanosarcina siciliae TaxID=38027 RepID=UPI000A64C12D|nr:hypothetical protein [Methanosarcina siciliae]